MDGSSLHLPNGSLPPRFVQTWLGIQRLPAQKFTLWLLGLRESSAAPDNGRPFSYMDVSPERVSSLGGLSVLAFKRPRD